MALANVTPLVGPPLPVKTAGGWFLIATDGRDVLVINKIGQVSNRGPVVERECPKNPN